MNPLLETNELPEFTAIKIAHIEPAVEAILAENRRALEAMLADQQLDADALIQKLEWQEERLARVWSPVSHLNSVKNDKDWQAAYNACLPKLSDYHSELGQNRALCDAFKAIAESSDFEQRPAAEQKLVTDALRDFRLSGVDLPADQQQRYRDISQRLSQLASQFEERLLDATQAWTHEITDAAGLAGLPDSARGLLRQAWQQRNPDSDQSGWLVTLDFPSFHAVMTHADDRALREKVYRAYFTRASEVGPNAGDFDNSAGMAETLALRHELAQLLDFENYAELSMATKMADSADQVESFLLELAAKAKPQAQAEFDNLKAFAATKLGLKTLEAWDMGWATEKLRLRDYGLSQEDLRPWFAAPKVFDGLFAIVQRLYGIEITEAENVSLWHEDVRCFQINDGNGSLRGMFYLDAYARQNKRGGAWMDVCRSRIRRADGGSDYPVAYLTCNATPPVAGQPALFTHDDVVTLFHEFGHGLHHMLTEVDLPSVGGIGGVEWDAVELPSQFMENWAWEREPLDLFALHHETSELLPADLYERMQAAKNFQSAMGLVRQIEFAVFDLRIHRDYQPGAEHIADTLQAVRNEVAVVQPPKFNRFANSFSHIFAGGYAAGYFSYLWAEVLSADAWGHFVEAGCFDADGGGRFLKEVLQVGGSRPAAESFRAFRGRDPESTPLLEQRGIALKAAA